LNDVVVVGCFVFAAAVVQMFACLVGCWLLVLVCLLVGLRVVRGFCVDGTLTQCESKSDLRFGSWPVVGGSAFRNQTVTPPAKFKLAEPKLLSPKEKKNVLLSILTV
jgi:hypothetical protein